MKIILAAGALAIVAGVAYSQKDRLFVAPNAYAGTPDKVYAALDAMDLPSGPQAPMGTLSIAKHGVAPQSFTWSGTGAHAAVDCTATLTPLGTDRTQVDMACGGSAPSEGAAAGAASDLLRIAMVEQIDSTLRGRPYDKRKVELASSMSVLKNLPKMESDALKMQREINRDIAAHDAAQAGATQSSAVSSGEQGMAASPPPLPGPLDPRGVDPVPSVTN